MVHQCIFHLPTNTAFHLINKMDEFGRGVLNRFSQQATGCNWMVANYVLSTFHINSMPFWHLGNLESRESSQGYEVLLGTSPAKVGRNGCKVFYV